MFHLVYQLDLLTNHNGFRAMLRASLALSTFLLALLASHFKHRNFDGLLIRDDNCPHQRQIAGRLSQLS
jgi:hypothetical protein